MIRTCIFLRAPMLVSFALAVVSTAPTLAAQRQPQRRAQSVSEIVAAVPDSAMRERWRAAERAGTLPPLEALAVPAQPVATRRRVVMQDTTPRRTPMLPEGTVADVRVFIAGDTAVREQRSELRLSEWRPGRIAGALPGGGGPILILYRLPGRPSGLAPRTGRLDVMVRDDVERASLRREVLLTDGNATVLFFLADGSDRPYAREFRELPLAVRQLEGDRTSVAPVQVRYGGEEFVLRPGERHQVADAAGTVEVYLGASFYTDPRGVTLAEGFPYYVRLMVYRVEER